MPLQRSNPTAAARGGGKGAHHNTPVSIYAPNEFESFELPLKYKTKLIKKMDENCYIFHCTIKGNSGCRFNQNMIVLIEEEDDNDQHNDNDNPDSGHHHHQNLTLVNPLRLTAEGEEHLLSLGTRIVNLIRLGPSIHAAFEDDYYLQKFSSTMKIRRWAPGPFSNCPNLPIHQTMYDSTNTKQVPSSVYLDAPISPLSPHPDVQVFVFDETVQPEAMLVLTTRKVGRVLITGDSLQYQQENPYVNEPCQKLLEQAGLIASSSTTTTTTTTTNDLPLVLSRTWIASQCVVANHSRKMQNSFKSNSAKRNTKAFFTSAGKLKLRNDFQRLLKVESLSRFLSTSGNNIWGGSKFNLPAAIDAAVEQAIPK